MLIIILMFLIIACIVSWLLDEENDGIVGPVCVLSSMGLIVSLVAFAILLISISNGSTIDSKIELYQTQNTEIESKIQATVASYLAHERQTYKDLKPDNAIAFVSAYSELHSNELVKKQIEVYEDNNKKIMGLREEKLNQSVYKWWLYFGR